MKNIETIEVKGITIKQMVVYVFSIISFVVMVVMRDAKRESKVETLEMKSKVNEVKIDALNTEVEALKTRVNSQDIEITRLKTLHEITK